LHSSKKGQTSSITAQIYRVLSAKHCEYILKLPKTKPYSNKKTKVAEEKWKKGNSRKQKESYFYNSHDFLTYGEKNGIKYDFTPIESPEFEMVFGKYLGVKSQSRIDDKQLNDDGICSEDKVFNNPLVKNDEESLIEEGRNVTDVKNVVQESDVQESGNSKYLFIILFQLVSRSFSCSLAIIVHFHGR